MRSASRRLTATGPAACADGASARWAATSPAKAAIDSAGSTLATARIAPVAPSGPAADSSHGEPTYSHPSNTSSVRTSRAGSPDESLIPATPTSTSRGSSSTSMPGADIAGKW